LSQRQLVLGFQSTLLKDKLALGQKILSCNFSGLKIKDFPIKGICSFHEANFNLFSKRLKLIYKLKDKNYFERFKKKPSYAINFDKNNCTVEKTKKLIKEILSK
jgi:hypothetical protein